MFLGSERIWNTREFSLKSRDYNFLRKVTAEVSLADDRVQVGLKMYAESSAFYSSKGLIVCVYN